MDTVEEAQLWVGYQGPGHLCFWYVADVQEYSKDGFSRHRLQETSLAAMSAGPPCRSMRNTELPLSLRIDTVPLVNPDDFEKSNYKHFLISRKRKYCA